MRNLLLADEFKSLISSNLTGFNNIPYDVSISLDISGLRKFILCDDGRVFCLDQYGRNVWRGSVGPCSSGGDSGYWFHVRYIRESDTLFLLHHDGTMLLIHLGMIPVDPLLFRDANAKITTMDMPEESVELLGSMDGGICAAAWNSENDRVLLATGSSRLIMMSTSWDVIREVDVDPYDPEVSLSQPGGVSLHWMDDEIVALTATPSPESSGAENSRFLHIFNAVDLSLANKGRNEDNSPVELLEGCVCSNSNYALFAVSQNIPARNRLQVSLFEQNGLRHRELVLPVQCAGSRVVDMKFNAECDMLAIVIEGVGKKFHSPLTSVASAPVSTSELIRGDIPRRKDIYDIDIEHIEKNTTVELRECVKIQDLVCFDAEPSLLTFFDLNGHSKTDSDAGNTDSTLHWRALLIYQRENYHWYLKRHKHYGSTLSVPPTALSSVVDTFRVVSEQLHAIEWDPSQSNRLFIVESEQTHKFAVSGNKFSLESTDSDLKMSGWQLEWAYSSSRDASGTVATIDGPKVLLSPLAISMVPPPSSFSTLEISPDSSSSDTRVSALFNTVTGMNCVAGGVSTPTDVDKLRNCVNLVAFEPKSGNANLPVRIAVVTAGRVAILPIRFLPPSPAPAGCKDDSSTVRDVGLTFHLNARVGDSGKALFGLPLKRKMLLQTFSNVSPANSRVPKLPLEETDAQELEIHSTSQPELQESEVAKHVLLYSQPLIFDCRHVPVEYRRSQLIPGAADDILELSESLAKLLQGARHFHWASSSSFSGSFLDKLECKMESASVCGLHELVFACSVLVDSSREGGDQDRVAREVVVAVLLQADDTGQRCVRARVLHFLDINSAVISASAAARWTPQQLVAGYADPERELAQLSEDGEANNSSSQGGRLAKRISKDLIALAQAEQFNRIHAVPVALRLRSGHVHVVQLVESLRLLRNSSFEGSQLRVIDPDFHIPLAPVNPATPSQWPEPLLRMDAGVNGHAVGTSNAICLSSTQFHLLLRICSAFERTVNGSPSFDAAALSNSEQRLSAVLYADISSAGCVRINNAPLSSLPAYSVSFSEKHGLLVHLHRGSVATVGFTHVSDLFRVSLGLPPLMQPMDASLLANPLLQLAVSEQDDSLFNNITSKPGKALLEEKNEPRELTEEEKLNLASVERSNQMVDSLVALGVPLYAGALPIQQIATLQTRFGQNASVFLQENSADGNSATEEFEQLLDRETGRLKEYKVHIAHPLAVRKLKSFHAAGLQQVRVVEAFSRLVTTIGPSDTLVLQHLRGNLEGVNPRAFTLSTIRALLRCGSAQDGAILSAQDVEYLVFGTNLQKLDQNKQDKVRERQLGVGLAHALSLARAHRLDVNILVDSFAHTLRPRVLRAAVRTLALLELAVPSARARQRADASHANDKFSQLLSALVPHSVVHLPAPGGPETAARTKKTPSTGKPHKRKPQVESTEISATNAESDKCRYPLPPWGDPTLYDGSYSSGREGGVNELSIELDDEETALFLPRKFEHLLLKHSAKLNRVCAALRSALVHEASLDALRVPSNRRFFGLLEIFEEENLENELQSILRNDHQVAVYARHPLVYSIITSYARQDPADLDSLLLTVQAVAKAESLGLEGPVSADAALRHALAVSDSNSELLSSIALGRYDLRLALSLNQRSQGDPRSYIPFLAHLARTASHSVLGGLSLVASERQSSDASSKLVSFTFNTNNDEKRIVIDPEHCSAPRVLLQEEAQDGHLHSVPQPLGVVLQRLAVDLHLGRWKLVLQLLGSYIEARFLLLSAVFSELQGMDEAALPILHAALPSTEFRRFSAENSAVIAQEEWLLDAEEDVLREVHWREQAQALSPLDPNEALLQAQQDPLGLLLRVAYTTQQFSVVNTTIQTLSRFLSSYSSVPSSSLHHSLSLNVRSAQAALAFAEGWSMAAATESADAELKCPAPRSLFSSFSEAASASEFSAPLQAPFRLLCPPALRSAVARVSSSSGAAGGKLWRAAEFFADRNLYFDLTALCLLFPQAVAPPQLLQTLQHSLPATDCPLLGRLCSDFSRDLEGTLFCDVALFLLGRVEPHVSFLAAAKLISQRSGDFSVPAGRIVGPQSLPRLLIPSLRALESSSRTLSSFVNNCCNSSSVFAAVSETAAPQDDEDVAFGGFGDDDEWEKETSAPVETTTILNSDETETSHEPGPWLLARPLAKLLQQPGPLGTHRAAAALLLLQHSSHLDREEALSLLCSPEPLPPLIGPALTLAVLASSPAEVRDAKELQQLVLEQVSNSNHWCAEIAQVIAPRVLSQARLAIQETNVRAARLRDSARALESCRRLRAASTIFDLLGLEDDLGLAIPGEIGAASTNCNSREWDEQSVFSAASSVLSRLTDSSRSSRASSAISSLASRASKASGAFSSFSAQQVSQRIVDVRSTLRLGGSSGSVNASARHADNSLAITRVFEQKARPRGQNHAIKNRSRLPGSHSEERELELQFLEQLPFVALSLHGIADLPQNTAAALRSQSFTKAVHALDQVSLLSSDISGFQNVIGKLRDSVGRSYVHVQGLDGPIVDPTSTLWMPNQLSTSTSPISDAENSLIKYSIWFERSLAALAAARFLGFTEAADGLSAALNSYSVALREILSAFPKRRDVMNEIRIMRGFPLGTDRVTVADGLILPLEVVEPRLDPALALPMALQLLESVGFALH